MESIKIIQEAKELIQKGNLQEASQILKALVVLEPNNVEAWTILGDISADINFKVSCYKNALEINPTDSILRQKLNKYMDSSTEKGKAPKSDFQLNRFHLIFLGILILVNIVLFIINTPPENNPLRKLIFQPEPTATSESISTDEDISEPQNTLATSTLTPTLRSTPTQTLFPTQTVNPTETPIPTPHYLGPVNSYLPSLDMLPPNFYSDNLLVKIVNYQGQDNFNDSSMSVFQNDKPLNNLTDHVYIVSYHTFLFDDSVQAFDFYEINSSQEGLNGYWNWLSDQNVIVRPFHYENNEKDGVKTTEYIVQIPGVQGYIIAVFNAFQTENLVYLITCVSSQTSENSVNTATSEASQFLELAQEMIEKE